MRQTILGLYIQDDIRVTPSFTLNLGSRYEPYSTPSEVNGLISTLRDLRPHVFNTADVDDLTLGNPLFLNPSALNFTPRVGFAWDPTGRGKFPSEAASECLLTPSQTPTSTKQHGACLPTSQCLPAQNRLSLSLSRDESAGVHHSGEQGPWSGGPSAEVVLSGRNTRVVIRRRRYCGEATT